MNLRICAFGVVLALTLTPLAAQESAEPVPEAADSGSTPDSRASATGASTAEETAASTSSPDGAETAGTSEVYDTIPVAPEESAEESAPQERAVQNRLVEEIVVTAQKREENVQDVPISIQAFSGEAMAARGLENTAQLGQVVPSLQFTNVAGFTLIFLRGIGNDNFIPSADPSIATYIDGIYIPAGPGAAISLGNVKRVEVLKGPQGTLFGRNATGGAINVVTEEPGDEFELSAEAEAGSFDQRSAKLSVAGPITDWLSASLSGLASRKDSVYSNINYEPEPDKAQAVRLKVNLHPSDNLSLGVTAYHLDDQGVGSRIGKNIRPSAVGGAAIQAQPDDYEAVSDFRAASKSSQDFLYANLGWNLPWLDLKLLGSDLQIVTDLSSVDFDGSPMPIAGFDTTNAFTDLQTAELQVLSNADTWLADRFKWVAGLYYFQSSAGFDPAHLFVAPSPIVGTNTGRLTFSGILDTESYAAYVQGTYTFADWLDLTLGGRYQRERRFLTKSNTRPSDAESPTIFSFPLDSAIARNFSPKAVLSLRPFDDALVYLSYSVGYKSGTFNIVNINTPPNYIVPEQVTALELGAKFDFLDGELRVNGALFNNKIKNLQSGFVSAASGGAVQFLTVPGARSRGAEMDGTWLPLPNWNPGLALTGNAAYVDAIYTDFPNGSGFNENTGAFEQNQNFSGNRIVRSPRLSGGLGALQAIEIADGTLEIAVDEYYNAGFYYDAKNTVEEKIYALLNARVSYLHTPSNLRITVFGKNVLDRRYHIQQFQTDFGVISTLAAPREFGLRLNWSF